MIVLTKHCDSCGAYMGDFDYCHDDIPTYCPDCAEQYDTDETDE